MGDEFFDNIYLNGVYSGTTTSKDDIIFNQPDSTQSNKLSSSKNQYITTTTSTDNYWSKYFLDDSIMSLYGNWKDCRKQTSLEEITPFLSECEIDYLVKVLIERHFPEDSLKEIFKNLLYSFHFSEDFLIKYFDYFPQEKLKENYAREINSHQFSKLALLLNVQ